MLKILPLITAAMLALSLPLIAQDGGPVLRVIEAEDQIVQIQVKTRHTTVIALPATENVLDFVVGDSEIGTGPGPLIWPSSNPSRRA